MVVLAFFVSVPPKKRNGETVPAITPAQVSTKASPVPSTPSSTPEDGQFDIQVDIKGIQFNVSGHLYKVIWKHGKVVAYKDG